MWKIEKRFRFEASHLLPHHDGKCARLHGHSWQATLVCEGKTLTDHGAKQGMLVDLTELGNVAKDLCEEYLDHHHLNNTTGLESPTCEELSRWIYHKAVIQLPLLVAVIVEETCTSRCEYRPERAD